jgi:hypothetical protein
MEVLLADQTRDDEKARRSWLLEVNARCESGIGIFPVAICVNTALAFQHQGQSGTTGHELVWHCPALASGKRVCQ